MGTGKEGTLQIKRFRGVDRYVEGASREPDKFEKIQNMYIPNPGELRSLNGVTKLTGAALPGLLDIKHSRFLDLGDFEKSLILFYTPTASAPVVPSTVVGDITTSGGSGSARDILIMYVGAGNSYSKKIFSAFSVEVNGITVPLPANVPAEISCIHVYIQDASSNYLWSGSFTRKSNVFPASISCPRPGTQVATTSPTFIDCGANKVIVNSFGTAGSLVGGKQYFLGVGPWLAGKDPGNAANTGRLCAVSTRNNTGDQFLSFYLPTGKNDANITLDFMTFGAPNNDPAPVTSDVAYTHAIVTCGVTDQDGLPINHDLNNGTAVPVAVTDVSKAIDFSTATRIKITHDSGNAPTKDSYIKVTSSTIANLTSNTYYFIGDITFISATQISCSVRDTFSGTAISTLGTSGAATANWKKCTFTIKHLPQNSDLNGIPDFYENNARTGTSPSTSAGVPIETEVMLATWVNASPLTQVPKGLGCMALTSFPHTPTNRREILSHHLSLSFRRDDHTDTVHTLSEFFVEPSATILSRPFANRIWCANAVNTPFSTNGYVLKPAVTARKKAVNDVQIYIPITKYIEFFKNTMILGGGVGNAVYQEGAVYYSDPAGTITKFSKAGSATLPNALLVRGNDDSEIKGMNIYSQDLNNVGPAAFLVIGKKFSVFTWDGDETKSPQQIAKAAGFAGPNCYTLTRFGPVYVSRDNVYLFRTAQDISPIGDQIKDILKNMSEADLELISAVYHDEDVKIGYRATSGLDREIWLRLLQQQGGTDVYWTGPHVMKPYNGQSIISAFGQDRDYRISFLDTNVFRRDDPGSFLNDTDPIIRSVKLSNATLGQDHMLKVLNRIYLHVGISQDEMIDMVLEGQDGAPSIVVNGTAKFLGAGKSLAQFWIPQRWLGRVLDLSIENVSDGALSIYDISFLFSMLRRRTIP